MQRKTKIIIAVTAALAVITLGSGTVLEMHAANDVSSVSQTTAPSTVTADSSKLTADSTSGTKQDYTVKYTDKSTGNQSATLQKKTYGSTSLSLIHI